MTVNWHREFAVNFATFLKVCRDFFSLLHRDFRLALPMRALRLYQCCDTAGLYTARHCI